MYKELFMESRVTAALFLCPEGGGHLYPVSNAFLEVVKRFYSDVKSGRTDVGGFAMPVDVPGSNT